MKKVMTAIIVFGMIVSPAVKVVAAVGDGDIPKAPPIEGVVSFVEDPPPPPVNADTPSMSLCR
ncbi:hypothetical protein AGMMS49921_13810 [Endomicrobiia bacterium]|nr:hypothetical protein AGMMS49921_13810 [Endomicrobiia bacterium]